MANIQAPFGFRYAGRIDGSPPNVGLAQRQILNTNTAAIFTGDPVANASGYIVQATPGTNPVEGVFAGCTWLSAAQNRIIHSPYWPANNGDAVAGTVTCLIHVDPMALFIVQATTGPFAIADVDKNFQFTAGTGNTATGFSGASANTPSAVTATLPFKVYGLYTTPVGNGGDTTTAFNWIYATFNSQAFKQLLAF